MLRKTIVKVIMLNKTCEYYKLVLELIFSHIPKSNSKISQAFCGVNQCNANFWVGLQKHVIPSPLYEERSYSML